jgi:hypothetical protein
MTGPALLVAIALAEATTASVAPRDPQWRGLVVVLVPPIDDDITRNALARVSGELAAAPFRTITKPIDPDRDVMAQVETAGSDQSAAAAFALVRDRSPGSSRVTIWVSNRISGTTTMQRMQVEGGNVDRAAARLAVETVELVRASLAGLWPAPAVETTPPPTVEKPAPPSPSRNARLALAVGVGLLTDFGDIPSTWAPQIAVSYGRPAGIGVRLFASGLGPGATLSANMGMVRLERALVTLGLVRSFRSDRVVQPLIGIAAGVHRLSGHGTSSDPPTRPLYDGDVYSAVATASVGVGFALGPRLALLIGADVLMTWPAAVIRVDEADVATLELPSLFTHVGLLATF